MKQLILIIIALNILSNLNGQITFSTKGIRTYENGEVIDREYKTIASFVISDNYNKMTHVQGKGKAVYEILDMYPSDDAGTNIFILEDKKGNSIVMSVTKSIRTILFSIEGSSKSYMYKKMESVSNDK